MGHIDGRSYICSVSTATLQFTEYDTSSHITLHVMQYTDYHLDSVAMLDNVAMVYCALCIVHLDSVAMLDNVTLL